MERLFASPEATIVAVITRPDAPVGRHQQILPSPVKRKALALGLTVLDPEKLKDEDFKNKFRALPADASLVVAYGKLIPNELLGLPRRGTLNVHPSLLPRHRGASPIQAALAEGERETGVSLMVLDAEMDHGPIVAQKKITLRGDETAAALAAALAIEAAELTAEFLPKYLNDEIKPVEQDHAQATFSKLLSRDSGRVDWQRGAEEIERQARAMEPWPGLWSVWQGNGKTARVKLGLPTIVAERLPPGAIKIVNGILTIGTATDSLAFKKIQLEGKREMPIDELLRGAPEFTAGRFT